MRILAIRGRNLNSLEGDFALDLEVEPFRRAGLFAITGPTGSGKSTLLDAMCLALYRKAPRLGLSDLRRGGRGAAPGSAEEKAPAATDPTSFLRRGTVEGFAEVDFIARDGKRYRARWRVSRARSKLDGTLKETWRVEAPGESKGPGDAAAPVVVADGLRETGAKLDDLIGLDYAQFSRSVLLPQGQFAGFLQANESDRAELLERMTGTALYGDLSMLARERFLQEDAQRQAIADQLGKLEVLGEEARRSLDECEAEHARGVSARVAEVDLLKAALRWFEEREQRIREEDHARGLLASAAQRMEALGPVIAERDAVRRVERFREIVREIDRIAVELEGAREERRGLEVRLEGMKAGEAILRDEEAMALRAHDEAAREEGARRPAFEQARAVEARLEPLRKEAERERASGVELVRERTEVEKRRKDLENRIALDQAQLEDLRRWTEEHAGWLPLLEDAGAWKERLKRHGVSGEEARRLEERRTALELEEAALVEKRAALDVALQEVESRRQEEIAARRELEESRARLEEETRAEEQQALAAEQELIRKCTSLDTDLTDVTQLKSEIGARLRMAREGLTRAETRLAEIEGERTGLAARVEEARRARDRLQAQHGLAAYRADLEAGEPCPLCGSGEHPWADQAPGIDTALATANRTLADLETDLATLDRERVDAVTRRATSTAQIEREGSELARAEARLATLLEAWRECVRLAAEPADPAGLAHPAPVDAPPAGARVESLLPDWGPGVREFVERWHERTDEKARRIEASRRVLDGLRKQQKKLLDRIESGREVEEQLRSKLLAVEKESVRIESDRRNGLTSLEKLHGERVAMRALLESAFPPAGTPGPLSGWHRAIETDAAGFIVTFQQLVDEWQTLAVGARASEGRLQKDQAVVIELVEKLQQIGKSVTDVTERERALTREIESLEEQRLELFGGRDPGVVRKELDEKVRSTRDALETARVGRQEAEKQRSALQGTHDAAAMRVEECERRHVELSRDLAARREPEGIEEREIRRLLAIPRERIEELDRAIKTVEDELATARTLLEERRRLREEHEGVGAPALEEAGVRARLETLAQELAETRQVHAELVRQQLQDDEKKALRASLDTDLQAKQARWRSWQQLDELIGSSDGKVFRRFAQSLNLDRLLEGANEHLRNFHPRYALKRIKGTDLRLEVLDLEMGNEARPVNSLSGGETFLVSLSLALGLSSFTRKNAKIESLFIDEGFGSLDARSLDVALDALEALQESGRQVGIISHVPGLPDRVGALLEVRPIAAGRSEVRVAGRAP